MRKALVTMLAVVGALASPQGATAEKRRTCERPGSEVVLESAEAVVYFTHKRTAYRAYACSNFRRNKGHRLLASWTGCECTAPEDAEPQVWLTGEMVAWNEWDCDDTGGCTGRTTSMRVTSGRVMRTSYSGPIIDLALMRNGSFAYVRVALNDPRTQADDVREVRKVDEEGETVLDAGDIDLYSLAQTWSRVYWLNAGQPRTARLQ
jgi:hypothetical protein